MRAPAQSAPQVKPPGAAELVAAFSGADAEQASASRPLAIACELCRAHRQQWEAEDDSRATTADGALLAEVKRRIDRMNITRSGLIEELDTWTSRHLEQVDGAPLHTETLGSVIDRLCIAWVRAQKLNGRGSSARGALATRQLRELAFAYDTLVAELIAGCRRVPDWRLLKSYGGA